MGAFELKHQEFIKTPFPAGLAGEEINGIELVLLDSDTAGILQKFIRNKGRLTTAEFELLNGLNKDMCSVITALEGVQKAYFLNLSNLLNEVMTRLNIEN